METANSRKKAYKATVDVEESRRKREELAIKIRKEKSAAQLRKRRTQQPPLSSVGADGSAPASDITLARLPEYVAGVHAHDFATQLSATTGFRKLLSIVNPPIEEVIQAGVIPRLIEFTQRGDTPHLQFEAAWALTNVASGDTKHTRVLVEAGAVPHLVQLLASPSDDVSEQAVWALGNIAGDCADCRDEVLHQGGLRMLLPKINQHAKITMIRNATWALSNFCRGKPQPSLTEIEHALPMLATLLFYNDNEVLTDACWALSYITDGPNDRIQKVLEVGVVARLVDLLVNGSTAVQTPALRTVGNIVTGDDIQTQVMLNSDCVPCLRYMLATTEKRGMRKEVCWTFSNIAAGNRKQIDLLIQAGAFPIVVDMLSRAEFETKKEAAWTISNASSGGTFEQVQHIVECKALPALCELLRLQDNRIVNIALDALGHILKHGEEIAPRLDPPVNPYRIIVEECGGLALIEDLQEHPATDMYDKVTNLIVQYFGGEDDDSDDGDDEDDDEDLHDGHYDFTAKQFNSAFN